MTDTPSNVIPFPQRRPSRDDFEDCLTRRPPIYFVGFFGASIPCDSIDEYRRLDEKAERTIMKIGLTMLAVSALPLVCIVLYVPVAFLLAALR